METDHPNLDKRIRNVLIAAGLVCIGGCYMLNKMENDVYPSPSTFKTVDNHFMNAKYFANQWGKGVKTFGKNKDIDGDNMDDYYIVLNNGKCYSTSSKRLLTGQDSTREKTWFQTSKQLIDNAKKGSYKAQ
jgi:hypothetical protein